MRATRTSRRNVLKGALGAAGAAALGGWPRRAAAAPQAAPHYLINIVRRGGWDSLWFHNAVPQSEVTGLIDTSRPLVSGQSFLAPSGNILAPFAANSSKNPARTKWTVRFPDSYLSLHPDGRTTLGPGLSFMQAADLAEVCIWRGVGSLGGHNLGNHILQRGGLSGSFPSFAASICAQAVEAGAARKLNYVQLAGNSVELATSTGAYAQLVQPINIPNLSAWTALTSPPGQQLSTPARRAMLADALGALAAVGATDPAALPGTRDVMTSFANSYQGGQAVLASNFGTSADFLATKAYYLDGITSIHDSHVFKTTWFSALPLDLKANGYLDLLAFRFALAEFLVKNDLSTAVDIGVPGDGDFHNDAEKECLYHLCLYAAFTLLVRRLKATESPAVPGTSMLDLTTVVMHSEFERHPLISALDEAHASTPGSDHGDFAASIWLAGKGVNRGKVVGDFKRDATNARFGTADYAAFAGYHPLPVDPKTGVVSPSGTVPSIASLCQTMLSIFGALGYSKLNDVPVFSPVTRG